MDTTTVGGADEAARMLEEACARFEAGWGSGSPPSIEELLGPAPESLRRPLLVELLRLDLARRTRGGEHPRPDEYLDRFRSEGDEVAAVFFGAQYWREGGPEPLPPLLSVPGHLLLGHLGRGGMGVVYKARREADGRHVAVKLMPADGADFGPDFARFQVEARAVACLAHPNIVKIHEVGTCLGQPYIVLEYAPGASLAARLTRGPLPPREAAAIAAALARALDHAHTRGILHRDLKPSNVLFAEDGTPKLSDFGLAKFVRPMREVSEEYCTAAVAFGEPARAVVLPHVEALRRAGEAATTIAGATASIDAGTRPGLILGSPHYMAPEQAEGRVDRIGPATDVYGLGATLYEMLAARPPVSGRGLINILAAVSSVPPEPLGVDVGPELEAVCFKCLAKDPGDRYANAAELAEDLGRFLDGRAVCATAAAPRRSPDGDVGRGAGEGSWVARLIGSITRSFTPSPPRRGG
jgi:serine/threonine protein kinase